MGEKITPVEYVRIDYICDKCNEGRMLQDGKICFMSDPVKIPHKCNKCGNEMTFTNSPYPRTGYRDIE